MNRKTLLSIPFPQQRYVNRLVAVFLLSIVIVTAVFWRLKLTGITLAGEAFCGMDEHVHTEECSAAGCEKQEHTHVELCYTDPEADVETAAEWEASLGDFEDTALYTSDLIAVAESQLGYTESERNFTVSQAGVKCGYTRYGAWYGNPYGEWSAMFVSFCLEYAGIPDTFAPYSAGAETMRTQWDQNGLLYGRDEYSPIPGDLIFFDTDADGKAETVGILTNYGTQLVVIQGDIEGTVAATTYLPDDGRILSYGSMNEVILASVTEDELVHLEFLIRLIDNLPSGEEVDETLTSLEEDMDAYEAYFLEVGTQARTAYYHWEGMGRLQPLVSNYGKARDLEWIWQSASFNVIESGNIPDLPVYAVNPKNAPALDDIGYATIIYGGSPAEYYLSIYPGDDQYSLRNSASCGYFQWWKAYVIEYDPAIGHYVSEIHYNYGVDQTKENIKPNSATGYVYFMHCVDANFTQDPGAENIPIGTFISLANDTDSQALFTIAGGETYPNKELSTSGNVPVLRGTLVTGDAPQPKDPIDNSDKLTLTPTVDTKDFIRINLYDYGETTGTRWSINDPFIGNNYYPAFKLGSTADLTDPLWDSLSTFGFDLGNLLAYDVERMDGINITNTINEIIDGNQPLSGYMYPKLLNGFPAVYGATGTDGDRELLPLMYLFNQGSGYVQKMNNENITNLLQFDKETGTYYYDSRKNFAQFDAATDTFIVYDQILTPGFAVYPFGNFLPLNDITTQATQVTSINREWFRNVAQSAWYKYVHGVDAEHVNTEEYRDIYLAITKLIPLMDYADGSGTPNYNWHYGNILEEYFGRTTTPDLPEPPATGENAQALLQNLYTLDFDEPTNFHFGMDMHMDFMMPKDGMTGKDGQHEMVYTFAGDDDVWIYIDEVLFLDLSGTHRHVGGEINFAKGEVYYYYLDPAKGDVYTHEELVDAISKGDSTKGRIVTFEEILESAGQPTNVLNSKGTFANYTEHTFDFYYMERGAGSSVCSMSFNMPLLQSNRVQVIKELENVDADAIGNPRFQFQILKANGTDKTNDPLIGKNVPYQVLDSYGNVVETRTTGENGVFYLYANERAVFEIPENAGDYFVRELLDTGIFEQYGKFNFEVNGESTTTDHYTEVVVNSTAFRGVDGPIQDASNGNTYFKFFNVVTEDSAENYGTFEIGKTANEYSDTVTPGTFKFSVMFGNLPLPVGTPYTLIDANGNETAMTVTTEGILTLQAGQRARFEKILAGTIVPVKELEAEKYFVQYTAESPSGTDYPLTVDADGYVTVPVNASAKTVLSVYNDRKGTKLEVEGEKFVLYPDGTERAYTFVLDQVDENGSLLAGGIYLEQTVTVTENGEFSFILNYPEETIPGTYYYRIYEKGADAKTGGDETVFPLTVEVKANEGGVLEAAATVTGIPIEFVNRNVRSLTISKTVEGLASPEGFTFDFTVNASVGDVKLNGEYHTDKGVIEFKDGVATFTLKHGESLTILDLPYGTVWTVTEAVASGFYTENAVDSGERVISRTASGELKENASVAYYNIGGAELPATGGFTRGLLPLVGSVLMLGSTAGAVLYRKKRGNA